MKVKCKVIYLFTKFAKTSVHGYVGGGAGAKKFLSSAAPVLQKAGLSS